MATETTRQSDEILPPIIGSIVNLPLTTAVLIVDLTSMSQTAARPPRLAKSQENTNPLGQYMTFLTQGAGVCISFASTSAALTSLSATATSTVVQAAPFSIPSGGTANASVQLTPGVPFQFRMPPGSTVPVDANGVPTTGAQGTHGAQSSARFLGAIMSSGTATLSVWVSSG